MNVRWARNREKISFLAPCSQDFKRRGKDKVRKKEFLGAHRRNSGEKKVKEEGETSRPFIKEEKKHAGIEKKKKKDELVEDVKGAGRCFRETPQRKGGQKKQTTIRRGMRGLVTGKEKQPVRTRTNLEGKEKGLPAYYTMARGCERLRKIFLQGEYHRRYPGCENVLKKERKKSLQ